MTDAIYTQTHTRFDTLIAGVLLAQVYQHYAKEVRSALERPAVVAGLLSVCAVCCWALIGPLGARYDITTIFAWGTVTSIMYFALCLLLIGSTSFVSRFLSSGAFLRFATLGYGMYLIHPPLVVLVAFPAAVVMRYQWHLPIVLVWLFALTLLVASSAAGAYLLHLLVEKPALWVRDRVAR